jgi:signal transduction histidine kinase
MPVLMVLTGPDSGKVFPLVLKQEFSIGRNEGNPIIIADPQVSRRHCSIIFNGTNLHITDLGSGNGTIIKGVKISTATVSLGERFRLGDSTIVFQSDDATMPGILRTVPLEAGASLWARPENAKSDWLKQRLLHLAVLYEATTLTSEVLDVDQLLGRILELAMRTTGADCGSVVLADAESGVWLPALNHQRLKNAVPAAISRTVVEYVRREKVGVLASDAGLDDRFAGGESIAAHGIREVIAVPMKGRHDLIGAIVLETLGSASEKFSEDHLTLALSLAHQAALAVEETRYYQAMLNAGKLAAVGQAVASLSHHIKNIMHGVKFGSDLVRKGIVESDAELLKTGWRLVERNQSKIDDLIQDMLSYSKEREPLMEDCDIQRLVQDVVDVVKGRAVDLGVTIDCHFEKEKSHGVVNCDSVGIHHVILNLLTNAIDALEGQPDAKITVHTTIHQNKTTITVSDNGPGVPPEERERIFEPFMSTKGSRGTGLGLPVSRKIMREHHGDLTLEEACCFKVEW